MTIWRYPVVGLLVVVLAGTVAGCGSHSSDNNHTNDGPVSTSQAPVTQRATGVPAALVGVWQLDQSYGTGGLTISADGTYSYDAALLNNDPSHHAGTVTVSGTQLTFHPSDGEGSLRYPGQEPVKRWVVDSAGLHLMDSQTNVLLQRQQ